MAISESAPFILKPSLVRVSHHRRQIAFDSQPTFSELTRPFPYTMSSLAIAAKLSQFFFSGGGAVGPDPLGRLRVDGHGVLLGSLVDDTERIETAVHVPVADCQACDLGPP